MRNNQEEDAAQNPSNRNNTKPSKLDLEQMIKRHEKNPIITASNMPFPCNSVFNAGAIRHNGKHILLLRVQDLTTVSHFVVAKSNDGIKFQIRNEYAVSPDKGHNEKGVEDARITEIAGTYYIPHTAYSPQGPGVSLAVTQDFQTFKRKGLILYPDTKNAVLHPEIVNEEFLLYHRPMENRNIWVAFSKDLKYWRSGQEPILHHGQGWNEIKIGPGAVPIRTEEGWLHILHGVQGPTIYRLGVALFDLKDPTKLIRVSKTPILSPRKDYERIGDVPNVVFTCGAIPESDGTVKIYYGGADTCICLATAKIEELVDIALNH
ncbi:MAG: glycoside hydrolase family 130 protein [Candidatus Woesearchaeota archaeon]